MSSGALAIPQSLPQEVVGFGRKPRTFILANGSSKELAPRFAGNMFIVPPRGKMEPDGRAGRGKDGKPIPGTRAVTDIFGINPQTGEEVFVLNAERAMIVILGIEKGSGDKMICLSAFAKRGLFILPGNASQDTIDAAFADAGERARIAELGDAYAYVAWFDAENAKRRAAGALPIAAGREYANAQRLINAEHGAQLAPATPAPAREELMGDLAAQAEIEAAVMQLAKETAEKYKLDPVQMFERLMAKPEVQQYVKKNFRGVRAGLAGEPKRKGHLDLAPQGPEPSEGELDSYREQMQREQEEAIANAVEVPPGEGIEDEVPQGEVPQGEGAAEPQGDAPAAEEPVE